eukprot:4069511-Prymnesium_polylepis.2
MASNIKIAVAGWYRIVTRQATRTGNAKKAHERSSSGFSLLPCVGLIDIASQRRVTRLAVSYSNSSHDHVLKMRVDVFGTSTKVTTLPHRDPNTGPM